MISKIINVLFLVFFIFLNVNQVFAGIFSEITKIQNCVQFKKSTHEVISYFEFNIDSEEQKEEIEIEHQNIIPFNRFSLNKIPTNTFGFQSKRIRISQTFQYKFKQHIWLFFKKLII